MIKEDQRSAKNASFRDGEQSFGQNGDAQNQSNSIDKSLVQNRLNELSEIKDASA